MFTVFEEVIVLAAQFFVALSAEDAREFGAERRFSAWRLPCSLSAVSRCRSTAASRSWRNSFALRQFVFKLPYVFRLLRDDCILPCKTFFEAFDKLLKGNIAFLQFLAVRTVFTAHESKITRVG